MTKIRKTILAGMCLCAAISAPALASDSPRPGTEPGAQANGPETGASGSGDTAKQESGSGSANESGGKDETPAVPYRHRPGACPEGPPCPEE
jgi:hypothetical protein